MATCKGCGKPVVWAETPDGHKQPFDREPNSEGNRILLGRGPHRPPLVLPLEHLDPPYGQPQVATMDCIYMPHHATCAKVDDFRQ